MTLARIYKPTKNAMQSGTRNTQDWLLEYAPEDPRFIEHIMGWTASADTKQQLRMTFNSSEEAVAFATKHGIPYQVLPTQEAKTVLKSYADNFSFQRVRTYSSPAAKPEASATEATKKPVKKTTAKPEPKKPEAEKPAPKPAAKKPAPKGKTKAA